MNSKSFIKCFLIGLAFVLFTAYFSPRYVLGADVSLSITIPDASITRIVAMLNAKYPKINGETTKQQAERAIRAMVRHEIREYERNLATQAARDGVVIPENIIQ